MTYIISVCSGKGGTGKTCTAINIANRLIELEKINHVYILSNGAIRDTVWIHEYCEGCGKSSDELQKHLTEAGIGTGIHYPIPVHLQPTISGFGGGAGSLPVTEAIVGDILSLPMYPELTAEQAERVVEAVLSFLKK